MLAVAIKLGNASALKETANPIKPNEIIIVIVVVAALISFCYGSYNYIIKNHDESLTPEKNEKPEL